MTDQAQRLRDIMEEKSYGRKVSNIPMHKNKAYIIAVTSGKGGVGKTNITLNLAIAMQQAGKNICVIDADIGLSNLEIISGQPMNRSLLDIIHKNFTIEDVLTKGPEGIYMISGGSGLNELNVIKDSEHSSKLLFEIQKLQDQFDYILIDTGAGISESVTNFIEISDMAIIISTPEPTSIMDAYVLIKTMTNLGYKGKYYYLTNMAKNINDWKRTSEKIKTATNSFLKLKVENLGYINSSDTVVKAVRHQTPFIILNSSSNASKKIKDISKIIINGKIIKEKSGIVERFLKTFRRK